MECWSAPDERILVKLDTEDACGSERGDEVFVLIDGFREVERVFKDDGYRDDDANSECSIAWEVEDDELVSVQEECFPSGRTNYAREIEIEDLEPLDEDDAPLEEEIRAALHKWREQSGVS